MSAHQWNHPPPGITLDDWFGDFYDEYVVLLQPFHIRTTHRFTEQARKDTPGLTWQGAASELGMSPQELARTVHTLLGSLAGASPASNEQLRQLESKRWALPPEDQIGSGVERVIGRLLMAVGVERAEARDEFDLGRATILSSDLMKDTSVFDQIGREVEPVVKVLAEEVPLLFAAAWDWPHVLVCGRGSGIAQLLSGAGAEVVELRGEEQPRRWWHTRASWSVNGRA